MKSSFNRPTVFPKTWLYFLIGLWASLSHCGQIPELPYEDRSHASRVFGKEKQYRLYLPKGYDRSTVRYPVVYFFHGWGGRHFTDPSAKLEYEKLGELVNKYQAILVMWDGNIDEKEPRPYNIGNHENITSNIQLSEYFPELVDYIDSTYRTLADRDHRGIIGFSMGGFMSWFLAGKYPHLVTAAVNMTGSPEFFVGYPENHTLYPLRYTFKNLKGVRLRFHNSTADELCKLNLEVHQGALWEGGLDYEYWTFEGGHKVDDPGKTEVFEKAVSFVATAFNNPLSKPDQWGHYDLYPQFSVWDYQVKSDKNEPGFIFLRRVSGKGFGLYTHRWLPDGPPVNACRIEVKTAPVYKPGTAYIISRYSKADKKVSQDTVTSDPEGCLTIRADQNGYEFGVALQEVSPDLVVGGYQMENQFRYLRTDRANKLTLTLFSRGPEITGNHKARIEVRSKDTSVKVRMENPVIDLFSGERVFQSPVFTLECKKQAPPNAQPSQVKINLILHLDSMKFEDELILPVLFEAPEATDLLIDDGRRWNDSLPILGIGNGDGLAAPGEEIMIYVNGHRTRFYTDDSFVLQDKERLVDEVVPAKWPDGFTLNSVIRMDPSCPDGHQVEGLASYETKGFMPIDRKLTWHRVKFRVKK
ncbi:MAG TPA: alpha/beta hydrolase-fold protein [Saprospiraceae bacterium]|nr:alpha/beta hydrolase-fold protein [Saprospiraceae bacterium]HNT19482.1 alpha/beta hydrolase-fold protein [Saprospiraceae bacterium]